MHLPSTAVPAVLVLAPAFPMLAMLRGGKQPKAGSIDRHEASLPPTDKSTIYKQAYVPVKLRVVAALRDGEGSPDPEAHDLEELLRQAHEYAAGTRTAAVGCTDMESSDRCSEPCADRLSETQLKSEHQYFSQLRYDARVSGVAAKRAATESLMGELGGLLGIAPPPDEASALLSPMATPAASPKRGPPPAGPSEPTGVASKWQAQQEQSLHEQTLANGKRLTLHELLLGAAEFNHSGVRENPSLQDELAMLRDVVAQQRAVIDEQNARIAALAEEGAAKDAAGLQLEKESLRLKQEVAGLKAEQGSMIEELRGRRDVCNLLVQTAVQVGRLPRASNTLTCRHHLPPPAPLRLHGGPPGERYGT